jgi:hypothetical protein
MPWVLIRPIAVHRMCFLPNIRESTSRQGQEYLSNCKNSVKRLQVRKDASLEVSGLPLLDLGIDWFYSQATARGRVRATLNPVA